MNTEVGIIIIAGVIFLVLLALMVLAIRRQRVELEANDDPLCQDTPENREALLNQFDRAMSSNSVNYLMELRRRWGFVFGDDEKYRRITIRIAQLEGGMGKNER